MAKTGDRFEMPDGSVYEVTRAAADTGGEFVEMVFTLPPGAVAPPPHVHYGITEEYEVLEGSFEVLSGDTWSSLGPGERASIPPATVHTFRNRGDAPVRVGNVHRPPGRFEDYIGDIERLMRAYNVTSKRDPRILLLLSMLMLDYEDTLAPGRARERIPIRAAAGLGRLLRLRTDATPAG